ncbi:hypothetical protein KO566_11490 [Flavobacteriaceae bacterium XHP0103]|uniref:hypothetical protein n=1 Tax=Marixanthotalea marina TaxID=2844359 RepID=UPI002989E948|nr:hypothetical protein [Marixanthotalea marina]MBU3822687.1 hypothetical protein [Marixanthotalea marina]
MKTKLRTVLLLSFFALLFITSCQEEVTDITPPNESEALVAESELTAFMSATAKMDGSLDNIIDKANCLSVELPVTVIANGLEVTVDSTEDYQVIEAVFNEFDDDDDNLDIVFPITIITSNYTEVTIENRDALENLIKECNGENEEDDDIECVDFQYPISFSVFNTDFQIIDVVTIESDRQMYKFIHRVKEGEVIASINFPVNLELTDGTVIEVNSNSQLHNTIKEYKGLCDEDDDNDYHDDDFTQDRLEELLKICPWVVYEVNRNQDNLTETYLEYVMVFKEEGVVKVRKRGGDILTGSWSTRVTDHGVALKLEFDTLVDFALEWYVYEIEYGRIKLYTDGGNKIILKKNCDIAVEFTKERIENYLQECFWRVARLTVDGSEHEQDYIGTPLKFFAENVVKMRVNGEFVTGVYNVLSYNSGFVLQIQLEGRPHLQLEWLITFLEPGLIKLESLGNNADKMVLQRHCPDIDEDLTFIDTALIAGAWEVALYKEGEVDKTENYFMYAVDFLITGRIKVTDPNNGTIYGSWLAYRNEGLRLGMLYENIEPFNVLSNRWKITSVTTTRIELKDFSSTGEVESILVLERKL